MATRIEILFQKLVDGSCSKQEYDELMDLLQQNQQEEKLRFMLSQVHQHTARSLPSGIYVDDTGVLQDAGGTSDVDMKAPVRQKRRWPVWMAFVAIILAVSMWGVFRPEAEIMDESSVKKITRRSEQKYLVLPDSTKVWLNVASTVEYPETFDRREIYLTGEAYFDVHDVPGRLFIIHTGNVTMRALGAGFNVKAYPDQTNVIVTVKRGKVQVSKNKKNVANLNWGQQVRIGAGTAIVNDKKVADWMNGWISFDNVPLIDVLNDLERNYNVSIELKDHAAEMQLVTVSFKKDIGVERVLGLLCGVGRLQWGMRSGVYWVSRK